MIEIANNHDGKKQDEPLRIMAIKSGGHDLSTNHGGAHFICADFKRSQPSNENGLKWIKIFFYSNAYFK